MYNSEKNKKYIGIIDTAINQVGFDSDDNSWKDDVDKIEDLINNQNRTKTLSFTFSENDTVDLLIIIHVKKGDESGESGGTHIANEFNKSILSQENDRTIKIVLLWITDDIESRVKINNNSISMYTQEIKKKNKKIKVKISQMFFCCKEPPKKEIKIIGINRYENTAVPSIGEMMNIQGKKKDTSNENEDQNLKGYIYTANLFNFAEIYNEIGDELFRSNVRLGINDTLGVDKEIKNTLENCPDTFWFKNNGITVLVEDPSFKLDRVSEIVLNSKNSSKLSFSVINGAQTITAAADFFFGNNYSEEKIKKAKEAKVLLRIICASAEAASEISVALNRQKPIKIEDIAYTNEVVIALNDYLSVNNKGYILTRRTAGQTLSENNFSLVDFARARKAISGDPGKARGSSSTALLKMEDGVFTDKDIFVKELEDADMPDAMGEVYNRYYSPIFFAAKIAKKYESLKKVVIKDAAGSVKTIIENGKWYFVAFLVYILNGDNDTDYTNFTYKLSSFKDEKIKKLISNFALFLDQVAEDPLIGSNDFKKSEYYSCLKKSDYKKTMFYNMVMNDEKKYELKNK